MMTIATCEAAQMLEAGWTVRYNRAVDLIEWRSPDGTSGYGFTTSLDKPPFAARAQALDRGDIKDFPRVAV